MQIKFKSPDPRAGMRVQLDSRLAQQFIDAGAADRVSDAEPAAQVVPPEASRPAVSPAKAAKPTKKAAASTAVADESQAKA
jgi:hypothetical protein